MVGGRGVGETIQVFFILKNWLTLLDNIGMTHCFRSRAEEFLVIVGLA